VERPRLIRHEGEPPSRGTLPSRSIWAALYELEAAWTLSTFCRHYGLIAGRARFQVGSSDCPKSSKNHTRIRDVAVAHNSHIPVLHVDWIFILGKKFYVVFAVCNFTFELKRRDNVVRDNRIARRYDVIIPSMS
jgi:hypothetical protein